MARSSPNQRDYSGGISSSPKVSKIPNSVRFTRNVDHRTDPSRITINPKAIKEFAAAALPMVGTTACSYDYAYLQNGDILRRDDSWSKIHRAADSVGNGFAFFPETREIIYAQNTTIGKITDPCTLTSQATDDFLSSQGGDPTNTRSLDLERSSSMYAARADTASSSITGDLTIEAYLKPETLPASNEIYALVSKWDEQANKRSYKMDITTQSNFFGDGRDGALTISTPTTEDPIDANCTGTTGTYTLTLTNAHASFASVAQGDKVFIHQSRGTGAGTKQFATVQSYSGGTLTLKELLTFSPLHSATAADANKAQIRVLKQHTTITINSTYTAKAWDGLKGGIMGAFGNVSLTGSGTITAAAKGYRGGTGFNLGGASGTGEGTAGASLPIIVSTSGVPNGNGGGSSKQAHSSGGSGGHATAGNQGNYSTLGSDGFIGQGGLSAGAADLSTMVFGGGAAGASGAAESTNGGIGGAMTIWCAPIITLSSMTLVSTNGENGRNHTVASGSGGSGGAGGSQLYKCQTINFGTAKVTSNGGTGGTKSGYGVNGVAGADGRIHVDYLTSISGTTSPNYSSAEDPSLGSADGHVLRLLISSTGTNIETYSTTITDLITIGWWDRWAVSWEDTTSTAKFYRNGSLIDTKTGTLTSINNNASQLAIGADFSSSGAAQNFYDGLMDDVRVWNDVRTPSELLIYNGQVLTGEDANLIAYYQFENDVTDSQTSGLNDLTAVNSPTYSTDVPFSGVTTRQDQDQSNTNDTYSDSYVLTTTISETIANKIEFVPNRDPQKSIVLSIDTLSTGIVTVTIHDALNRTVATSSAAVGELSLGFYEFIYTEPFRPVIGATYHMHITSTVADGAIDTKAATTGLSDDTEVFAYFTTHYQFLVEDEYHPHLPFAGLMSIGNERYIATLEPGDLYEPHALALPAGFRVRCATRWREYAVYGCWKGSSITSSEEGLLCFWDGVSGNFNFIVPVPEGGVNSMFIYQDTIVLVAGYQGTILAYQGGGSVQRINHIPGVARDKRIEVAPGGMCTWRTYLCMGFDLSTNSEAVYKGVYTLGSLDSGYPISLGFEYETSLGDQTGSSVSIGMVYPSGQNLYIGWKNDNTYGIDRVSVTNDCYETGSLESLITDYGTIAKERQPLAIRGDFEELLDGQSFRAKYRHNRAANWNYSDWEDTVGATDIRWPIEDKGKELEVGIDMKSTSGVSPAFLGWTVEVEALEGEIDV